MISMNAGPIYSQIAQRIKDDIVSGKLHEEEQVMSTNQYASFYQINPATTAKGFEQLEEEGILYMKPGIGMFVSRNARDKVLAERRQQFFAKIVDPMIEEAYKIGMPLKEIIARLEQQEGAKDS
ncbi:DNA-binding transcriptional regulator YhcF (GntR family) [Paenibacillus phyllosphaerae]|uniref:DNA-binding transcriptional regulator YhcF (GntR family) n=2 Tax=Paenibacillus phyllosphaerae TaxID=274593 RepID=A0A7W5AUU6_9BACL|nr:DNA-binding transcriptional regulator YhcF (GntR family) [Paenibacillus phyllosphaerae]